jgi:hypothetical protein
MVIEGIQQLRERSQFEGKCVAKKSTHLLATIGCCMAAYEFPCHCMSA